MNFRILCLVIFLLLPGTCLQAGVLRHIGSAELAGARDIYHAVRTSDGFLWFCTDNGLFRFDGQHLDRYSTADGLPDNNILNLFEDYRGRLWLFCFNGAPAFLLEGRIHTAATDPGLAQWPVMNAYLMQVLQGSDSSLYFGYTSGDVYRLRSERLTKVSLRRGAAGLSFFGFEASNGTPELRVFGAEVPFKRWYEYGMMIQADSAGFLVRKGPVLRRYPVKVQPAAVIHACLTRDGMLCYGTRDGLRIVPPGTFCQTALLRNLTVSCIVEDRDGTVWVATLGDGAWLLGAPLPDAGNLTVPKGGRVLRMHDELLSRSPGGTRLLQQVGGRPAFVPVRELPAHDADPLYIDSSFVVFNDLVRDSTIYIERSTGHRIGYRLKSKAVFRHGNSFFSYGYSRDQFWYVRRDSNGLRLAASGHFPAYIHAAGQAGGTGAVWFVTDDRLCRADPGAAGSSCVRRDPLLRDIKRIYALQRGLVLQTFADKIWILPADSLLHGRAVPVDAFGSPVSDIQLISDTSALIRMARGLVYAGLHRAGIRVQPLLAGSGTGGDELFAWRGTLFRVGALGLEQQPRMLSARAAPVYLRSLRINGNVYDSDSLRLANTSELDIQVSVGTIAFGGNPFVEYRLAGSQATPWRIMDGETLNLRLAGPGLHEIQFRAVNAPRAGYRLRIWTTPPFFRSVSFYLILAVFAVAGALAAAVFFLRSRERSWRKAYEELQLKHRSTNALLNPHFVFNAISNIQGLIHQGNGARAEEYLNELSRMIRQNMENLRQDLIPLSRELQLIEAYINLQNMRDSNETSCRIRTQLGAETVVEVPPLILQTFVENAIVHGRRNGDPLHIDIELELSIDRYLIATVRDDGRGVHEAMKASSWNLKRMHLGIDFNRERLHRLNQVYGLNQSISITDRSETGQRGTEVLVIVSAKLHELFGERAPAADG